MRAWADSTFCDETWPSMLAPVVFALEAARAKSLSFVGFMTMMVNATILGASKAATV